MNITVAICTWNRAHLLDQTLAELRKIKIPAGIEWELLVVDNNCTDDTPAIIAKYTSDLPIRRVLEPSQGQSNARNRAIIEAKTEWVVFTDDDVLVDPHWLMAYIHATQSAGDNVVLLGGEILPWFPEAPDPALAAAMPMVVDGFCGRRIPTELHIAASTEYLPLGANFALRKSLLGNHRFDPSLGIVKNQRVLGEEVALFRQLLVTGLTGKWVINASVRHYVEPLRLKLSSLRRQLFGMGRQNVRTNGPPAGRFRIGGMPGWVFRSSMESLIGMAICSVIGQRERFYRSFASFWMECGAIYEHFCGSRAVSKSIE